MPIIHHSSYSGPPRWQWNGHLQTMIPGALRRIKNIDYQRERIETPDADFLDLDWRTKHGHQRLVIISHGLEGDSRAQYVLGTARLFFENGWDVLAWNCRSCSGEMNRQFRMYHHGDIEDIGLVIQHALGKGKYRQLALTGYSMGANITLKYLGVTGKNVPKELCAAAVFSAPTDIRAGADVLDRWDNLIYKRRFMWMLYKKIKIKAQQHPGRLRPEKFRQVRRWYDFDEFFSAPICGFASADEFHQQASAKNFLAGIAVPTLLASAKNDPILTSECFPVEIAREHPFLHLELPESGGHCGFQQAGNKQHSWAEERALEFCMGGIVG